MTSEEPSIRDMKERVREDFDLFREAVQRETDEWRNRAYGFVREHPYQAVGAAFGVGFLLAGGLFSRFTGRTLSFGTRFLLGRMVRQLVTGAAAGFATRPSESATHH